MNFESRREGMAVRTITGRANKGKSLLLGTEEKKHLPLSGRGGNIRTSTWAAERKKEGKRSLYLLKKRKKKRRFTYFKKEQKNTPPSRTFLFLAHIGKEKDASPTAPWCSKEGTGKSTLASCLYLIKGENQRFLLNRDCYWETGLSLKGKKKSD